MTRRQENQGLVNEFITSEFLTIYLFLKTLWLFKITLPLAIDTLANILMATLSSN